MRAMDAEEQLRQAYAALGADELLRLAGQRAELTETAQAALQAELRGRGMAAPAAEAERRGLAVEEDEGAAAERVVLEAAEDDPSQVLLWYFPVVAEAWAAADLLGERGVEVRVEPAWTRVESKKELPEDMDPAIHGVADPRTVYRTRVMVPGVNLYIDRTRQEEAVALLRERMGLFPEAEVDDRAGGSDGAEEEVLFSVGEFASAADADVVETALRGAGIRVQVEREGGMVAVMVPFEDLERATAVMEAAMRV